MILLSDGHAREQIVTGRSTVLKMAAHFCGCYFRPEREEAGGAAEMQMSRILVSAAWWASRGGRPVNSAAGMPRLHSGMPSIMMVTMVCGGWRRDDVDSWISRSRRTEIGRVAFGGLVWSPVRANKIPTEWCRARDGKGGLQGGMRRGSSANNGVGETRGGQCNALSIQKGQGWASGMRSCAVQPLVGDTDLASTTQSCGTVDVLR